MNERCRVDYEAMPTEVRESADQVIDALQNARPLPPKLYQPLGGTLVGINEIRLGYDDNTYRVYVSLKCPWVIKADYDKRKARRDEFAEENGP